MADGLDKILGDVREARERQASRAEIDNLAKRVDAAATASVGAAEMANGMAKNFAQNLTNMIPGRSAITAAVTANNPLLAGAAQLIGDMRDSQREAVALAEASRSDTLKEVQRELSQLQKSEEKSLPQAQNEQETVVPQPTLIDMPSLEPVSEKLEELKAAVDNSELVNIGRQQLQMLNSMYKEWSGSDHEIITAMNAQTAEAEKLTQLTEEMMAAEEAAYAEDKLRRSDTSGASGNVPSTTVPDVIPDVDQPDLGALGSMLGGLGGLSSMAAKLLGPLSKVTKLFRVGPLALITAAFDFGKGFLNAGEILGKENVQVSDRLQAGVASLLGGIGSIGDMIAGLFGMDTDMETFLKDNTIDITQPLIDGMNKVTGFISQIWDNIDPSTAMSEIPALIKQNLDKMWESIKGKVTGMFDFFSDDEDEPRGVNKDASKMFNKSYMGSYTSKATDTQGYSYSGVNKGQETMVAIHKLNREAAAIEAAEKQRKEQEIAQTREKQDAKMNSVIQTTMQNTVTNMTTIASKEVRVDNPRLTSFGTFDTQ
ncbi:coil containing protein [Vibrio phage 1.244.A._10N.261.54.C3]|nr:coil containing protein [Vibrio phage 1.244.A._10N.261.54.C3]AUR98710.1 coil containing protein [Vibrio phage 1.255.O._10N.286.45.F1]